MALLFSGLGCASESAAEPAIDSAAESTDDAFLEPYVKQLEQELSPEDLDSIRAMAESELITLHHGFGTWIRNMWLWGRREPQLVQYFEARGIDHPDSMSMEIIEALWRDLNRNLTPEERASIEAERALVARRQATYARLASECSAKVTAAVPEIESCYEEHGLPSANPLSREPFFHIVVDHTGHVRSIQFFTGGSPEVQECLRPIIEAFEFTPFADDEFLRVYFIEYPGQCQVQEAFSLHDRR